MKHKKQRLTHSQINGIIWITITLTTILIIIFFSHPKASNSIVTDSIQQEDISILQKKEDSVYRSRRHYTNARKRDYYPSRIHDTTPLYSSTPPAPTRQPLSVEINSADSTTLMLLHGIGPAFARRIVKYRNRLGGFYSTDQLLEVYGFTPQLLNHIAPHIKLDNKNLKKIPINTATLKELIKHPYVEYYFARDLVNLRSRGMHFESADDLRTIPSCTDTMLTRLSPYLDFTIK